MSIGIGVVEYRRGGKKYLVPEGKMCITKNGSMWVRDTGEDSKPSLILIHGWGVDSLINWGGVIESLRADHRVVTIDLPGHGGSDPVRPFKIPETAETVVEATRTIGIEQPIVAGYSLGGAVALHVAEMLGTNCRGIVAAATGARLVRTFGAGGVSLAGKVLSVGLGKRPSTGGEKPVVSDKAHLIRTIFRHDDATLGEALQEAAKFDGRGTAGGLNIPAACIITESDSVVPHSLQRELAELLRARVWEVDASHDYCMKPEFAETMVEAVRFVSGS